MSTDSLSTHYDAVDVPAAQFPQDRERLIVQMLDERGSVASSDLAVSFGVNQATIRRDLKRLADQGLVSLVHGGARRTPGRGPLVHEVDLATKQVTNIEAKEVLARKAVELIRPGATVAMNSGSTIEMLAARIPLTTKGCTFVTLSLGVANMLAERPDSRLLLAGGMYRSQSQAFVGDFAVEVLQSLRADIAFIGATAVDTGAGWTHPALEEVRPNRAMLTMAARRYLLCDSSKFGVTALTRVADLDEFTGIIADDDLPGEVREWAVEHGLEVV